MKYLTDMLVNLSPAADILLKASVLLALGWALHTTLRIRQTNPQWRRMLWRGVMAGLLLIPLAQLIWGWQVHVARPAALRTEKAIVMPTEKPITPVRPIPSSSAAPATSPRQIAPDRPSAYAARLWVGEHIPKLLLAGWLLGAAVLFVRYWVLIARISGMRARSRPAGPRSQCLLDRVAREMGNRNRVLLRFVPGIESPFLTGLRQPMIVLPDHMEGGVYAEDLASILSHEVAHIRAHDLWWMALGRLISTLVWFHPLVWRLRAAHSMACEEACDAAAAQYVGNPEMYTTTLARVALAIVGPVPSVGGIPMARSSQIVSRLRLLQAGVQSSPVSRWRVFFCAMLGVVVLAGVASVRLVYAEGAASATPPVESRMWTKIVEPRDRTLRVGFPLAMGESFVFDNSSDVLQGKLTMRIVRQRTREHAAATEEYTIFEKGKVAEGWRITEGGTRLIYENGTSAPARRVVISGVENQFFSTERHLTAPDDRLDLELVAVKDLTGKTSLETGYLPAGTYKAKGKYAALTDEFDSASYLAQYVKDGEKPSPGVLDGLAKSRAANEWSAWLTDWDAEWPLKITAKGGWLRSTDQVTLTEDAVRQATATVKANQHSQMAQERKWRQEFIVADQGPEAACRVNIFEIMHALATYQEPHHDLYPSSLADLFPKYLDYPDALVCPSTKKSPILGNGMTCSYRYLGPVLSMDAFPALFIVYDRPTNHQGRNVGLFNGQIEFYKEAEFKQALATQYERLKPVMDRADFPGDRERARAFFEDKDFY